MTDAEKLTRLSGMVDESDTDLLSTYLEIAKGVVLSNVYPYRDDVTEVPPRYDTVQIEIAQFLYLKRGAEGEIVHLENGVSRHWENGDIPYTILRRLTPNVGVL